MFPPRLLIREELTAVIAVDVFRSPLSKGSAELLRLLGQEELRLTDSLRK